MKFVEVHKIEALAAEWLGSRRTTPEDAAMQYLGELGRHTDLLEERGADLPMITKVATLDFRNVISKRG